MKHSGKVAVIVAVLVVLLLPVGYVLSSGPALWLLDHGYLGSNSWRTIYRPLYFLNPLADPLEGPLYAPLWWYWGLWSGPPAAIPT
jgi:hypothetical protein